MTQTVVIHGFRLIDGGQEHCDLDDSNVAGFCVYLRTETPHDRLEPFRISHETDFCIGADDDRLERLDDARAYAEDVLGQRFACDVFEE